MVVTWEKQQEHRQKEKKEKKKNVPLPPSRTRIYESEHVKSTGYSITT